MRHGRLLAFRRFLGVTSLTVMMTAAHGTLAQEAAAPSRSAFFLERPQSEDCPTIGDGAIASRAVSRPCAAAVPPIEKRRTDPILRQPFSSLKQPSEFEHRIDSASQKQLERHDLSQQLRHHFTVGHWDRGHVAPIGLRDRSVSPEDVEIFARRVGGRVASEVLREYTRELPAVTFVQRIQDNANRHLDRYKVGLGAGSGPRFDIRGVLNLSGGKILGAELRGRYRMMDVSAEIYSVGVDVRGTLYSNNRLHASIGGYQSFRNPERRGVMLLLRYSLD